MTLNLGSTPLHLYDCATGTFVATNVSGTYGLTLPAESSIVLVYCPASSPIGQKGATLAVGGSGIDYGNAATDRDGDGLPDWWETRYFGSATGATPVTTAANGLSNVQCYWLGLNPLNPLSRFVASIDRQPGSNSPRITWPSVGGKTYSVEYADTLDPAGATFTPVFTVTEDAVVTGAGSTRTFIDDFTLTSGAPTSGTRYYRIRLVTP